MLLTIWPVCSSERLLMEVYVSVASARLCMSGVSPYWLPRGSPGSG